MIASSVIAMLLASASPGEIPPADREVLTEPAPMLAWRLPHYPGTPRVPSIPNVPSAPKVPRVPRGF